MVIANPSGISVDAGGSVNVASSRINGDYASVTEQSGVQAGTGGFQVHVAGNTNLTGGVIASTQAAVDSGANAFATAGALTTSDVQNHDNYDASGFSAGTSYSAGGTGTSGTGQPQPNNIAGGVNGGAVGFGSESGSNGSVTTAGISGVAGDTAVRTGDATQGIVKAWDADELQREVQAQVQITSTFSQQASSAWGEFANRKFVEAMTDGDTEASECWSPSGSCRAAGHAVLGGMVGGIGGAMGSAASSYTATAVHSMLTDIGVPSAIADGLTAAYGAGIGAVAGGGVGAAGGMNEAANNSAMAARLMVGAIEVGGAALARRCLTSTSCVALLGTAFLNAIISANNRPVGDPTLGDVNSNAFGGTEAQLPADTYGMPPNGAAPPPDKDKNPTKDRTLNQDGDMLGENGAQFSSRTVYSENGMRIDVENANPGQRAGQLHLQLDGAKYIYNINTASFETEAGAAAPRYINRLVDNSYVRRAVATGLRYLGEK